MMGTENRGAMSPSQLMSAALLLWHWDKFLIHDFGLNGNSYRPDDRVVATLMAHNK